MSDGGHRKPVYAVDHLLVRRLQSRVGARRERALEEFRRNGQAIPQGEDARLHTENLMVKVLNQYESELVESGREPLDETARDRLEAALKARLFGAGSLEQLLEDDSVGAGPEDRDVRQGPVPGVPDRRPDRWRALHQLDQREDRALRAPTSSDGSRGVQRALRGRPGRLRRGPAQLRGRLPPPGDADRARGNGPRRVAIVTRQAGAAAAITEHDPCREGRVLAERDRPVRQRRGPMIASKPVRLLSLAIVALVVLVGVNGIVGGIAFSGGNTEPAAAGKRTAGVVTYVLDGDTVEVSTNGGRTVRVRFLGISAPEIPHPGKAGECYGYPSTRHLKQLLPAGAHVTLISDPTQDDVDTYGRQLRYVEAAGRDIGRAQILSGSAAARDSSDPVSRHAAYVQVEDQARKRGAGIWTACH
jgi:micrococcal nuclease